MKKRCTKFRNYRPYTAKPLGTWNPTDNHTDIEVPLYDKLRFHEANKSDGYQSLQYPDHGVGFENNCSWNIHNFMKWRQLWDDTYACHIFVIEYQIMITNQHLVILRGKRNVGLIVYSICKIHLFMNNPIYLTEIRFMTKLYGLLTGKAENFNLVNGSLAVCDLPTKFCFAH